MDFNTIFKKNQIFKWSLDQNCFNGIYIDLFYADEEIKNNFFQWNNFYNLMTLH